MSHVAARVIGDLPGFFSVVDDDWHQDLIGFPVRLMDRGERGLLRVSPEAVVAFRYHDVLDLANQRDVGNMPVEVLAGQSSRRETGGGAHAAAGPAGSAGAAGTERAMFRMLADQAFTHIPPLHRFTRHALSRSFSAATCGSSSRSRGRSPPRWRPAWPAGPGSTSAPTWRGRTWPGSGAT